MKSHIKVFCFPLLFFIFFATSAFATFQCANPREFEKAFSQNLNGQIDIIGNSVVCKKTTDANGSNVCGDPGNTRNNSINMMYINVDGNASTFNHSSADLNITADSEVVWAVLYWQGLFAGPDDIDQNNSKTVKLKVPGGDYVDIVSEDTKYNWVYLSETHDRWMYQGARDITDKIDTTNPNGTYTVANLSTATGKPAGGSYGAWSIVLAYKNATMPFRNLTIYDGFQGVMPGGNGATCNDRSKDPKKACLYAQEHNCSIATADTGVANPITVPLSGFLTPKANSVDSSFAIFSGEGDRGKTGDSLTISDASNTPHLISDAENPVNDIQNATISKNGVPVLTLEPQRTMAGGLAPWINSLGADIDFFDISGILSNNQTSTNITMETNGDGYFPGVFAFSTDIYAPRFCYDYAYKQQGRYFTEDNDGTQNPKITGTDIQTHEPIQVTMFIRNLVTSDIDVNNMLVQVTDINTSEASYINNSTKLSKVGNLAPTSILDSNLVVGSDSHGDYIKDIDIGSIGSNDFFYLYYSLDPIQTTINMPIKVQATYDLTLNGTTIPYTLSVGSNLEMCSSTNFQYTPQPGLFNIASDRYYPYINDTSKHYYNLPTVVTSKADAYKALAYDASDSTFTTLKDANVTVAVELIDAAAFHDTFASCNEPTSAISDRVWITFENNTTAPFTAQQIINSYLTKDGTGTNTNADKEFYKTARENAAFRVSWDDNGSGSTIRTITDAPGLYHLENFSNYATEACVQPVTTDVETSPGHFVTKTYTQVPQACFNAGKSSASSMNDKQLAVCMECIYGKSLNYVCSRDNFSIRPEAFLVQIDDQNQTNTTLQTDITTLANSGSNGAIAPELNLSADYNYNIEVNATNHYSNDSSYGYTKTMNLSSTDPAWYIWEPRSSIATGACNDENNKTITMRFVNGAVNRDTSVAQVGEYRLNIKDTTWTTVDNNPSFMSHHDLSSDFLPSSVPDCILNSSIVQLQGSTALNGCEIDSSHTNTEASLQYNDYNVTFHPYAFAVSNTVTLGKGNGGAGVSPAVMHEPAKPFVYMSNLSDDENMSVHLNTTVTARGRNSAAGLTNYVTGCFSKPLNLSIAKTATTNPALAYNYIVHNKDINGTVLPANDINKTIIAGNTAENPAFTTTSAFFQKDQNGTVQLLTNLNYKRDVNVTTNPEDINFTTISADDNATLFNADLVANKYAEGNISVNQRVLYYYGRTIAPKITVVCNSNICRTGISATNNNNIKELISYAIYCQGGSCNSSILPTGALQVGDIRWFENRNHDNSGQALTTDGGIGTVTEVSNSGNVLDINRTISAANYENEEVIQYTGPLPYDAIMQMQSSPWLIYNESDANATKNTFVIQFVGDGGWSGKYEDNTTTKTNFSNKTNRRIMW